MMINLPPGNSTCCDCGCTVGSVQRKQFTWASVARGTLLCDDCTFQHMRSCAMGNGRENEFKSFETDLNWTFSEIVSMLEGGNAAFLPEMHLRKKQEVMPTLLQLRRLYFPIAISTLSTLPSRFRSIETCSGKRY